MTKPTLSPVAKGVALATLVIAVALALWAFLTLDVDFDATLAFLERHRDWAMLLVVLLMIAHCALPFPAEILALAAGAMFGVVWGTALIWIGAMIGAALTFWICRRLGRPIVRAHVSRRVLDRIEGVSGRDLILVLMLARLTPVIAFNLVNMAAALTSATWAVFLITTAIGVLPMTLAMVWMGAGLAHLPFAEATAAFAALIAIALAVIAVKTHRKRRAVSERT